MDGQRYHASPEHDRLADDATKRQAVLDSGRYVWSLTWQDVQAFHDAMRSDPVRVAPPSGLLERAQEHVADSLRDAFGGYCRPEW